MYLCIDILSNRIESILSCLSYILSCYSFHASVPGTGRGFRYDCPCLSRILLRGVGGNSASLGERQGDAVKHPTTESVLHFWKSFENR